MFWLRKPKSPALTILQTVEWPGPTKRYEFDRWVWFSTPAPGESPAEEDWEIVVREGARALYYDWASEKSRPSCMWDWISPTRLRSVTSYK